MKPHLTSLPCSDRETLSFELFAFRFQFRARTSLYFPAGKAGNIVRGALGRIFRKYACTPGCSGARVCEQRSSCAYARLFEPTAEPTAGAQGPSGFADWPRPFVIRAGHLDERRCRPGETFHFDLHVFEMREPALAYFTFSFSQLMREGLGPGRAATELTAVYTLDSHGQEAARIFDGRALLEPQPLILPLRPGSAAVRRIRIQFLSPTELKGAGEINQQPEFGILFARARDRLHNLRKLYGAGPLTFDFKAAGERARQVNLLNSQRLGRLTNAAVAGRDKRILWAGWWERQSTRATWANFCLTCTRPHGQAWDVRQHGAKDISRQQFSIRNKKS